jgi:hypothetical protein
MLYLCIEYKYLLCEGEIEVMFLSSNDFESTSNIDTNHNFYKDSSFKNYKCKSF